jgi:hypothetical protein
MADLLGGTSGQVLAKNSNTDMDFVWVAQDDSNAIQNTIVDAKGDLIAASASDVPARLAVGNNGETLVADSSTSTGLRYQGLFGANKNAILNADFNINQRGLTSTTTNNIYGFDRWTWLYSGGTATWSAQTFTPGAAPVAGYESTNFSRVVTSGQSGTGDYAFVGQRIENVRTFAGQTVTVSFWAKAATGTPKVGISLEQSFGSGGSGGVIVNAGNVTISTSWARYSVTASIPSISGKTIGTGSFLILELWSSAGSTLSAYTGIGVQNATIDIWGVQVEAGSVATPFQTATGTLQGEFSACQRYYERVSGSSTLGAGRYFSTTAADVAFPYKVTKRTTPTFGSAAAANFNSGSVGVLNSITTNGIYVDSMTIRIGHVATTTTGYACILTGDTSAYIEVIAEL